MFYKYKIWNLTYIGAHYKQVILSLLHRDGPYITTYILEGCLTPTPPIVINHHILASPPPSISIILSYFDIPPFTFHINIKSAFIFNPVEITSILFSLINHPYLHVRDHLRSNCKIERSFPKFSWSLLVYLHFFHSVILSYNCQPPPLSNCDL